MINLELSKWLTNRNIILEEGFSECLIRYAKDYKKK